MCDDELVQEGEEYSGIIVGFDVLCEVSNQLGLDIYIYVQH